MPIDRKGYRAAKKKYKGKVKANKDVVKSNKKIDKANKSAIKSYVKTVKKSDKKYEKSEKAAIKAHREKHGGNSVPRIPAPKPMFGANLGSSPKMAQAPTGLKPKRSDYKGSKPQRATGSNASKMRMAKVIGQLNSAKMFMNTRRNLRK
jgi:hypothetical protein